MRLISGLSMAVALALVSPVYALEVDTTKILPKSFFRGKEGGKQNSAFVQQSSVVRKRTARVIYGRVSVYGEHDTGSGAVEVVDQGGELEVLGDEAVAGEIWYKVRTKNGKEGWVQQSLKNIVLGGGYDLKKAGPTKSEGGERPPAVAAPKITQQEAAGIAVQQHAPITFSLSQPPTIEACTVAAGGRLAPGCASQASALPAKATGIGKHEDLSTVKEAPESRVEVEYRDVPVRIPVSGSEINVIAVPYPILDVDTSKENLKELGKAEREFSISVLQNVPTDVAVRTAKKTFLLTLIPTPKTASLIVVRDAGPGYQQGRTSEEEGKEFPYPEMLVSLMDSAEDGLAPEGYASVQASKMYDTPEVLMVLKREYVGVKYKIVSIDIVNKTGTVLRVREDMPFILNAISKLTDKRPLGVRLLREFLQPRAGTAEARGEFVTTLIAVVGS